MCSPGIKQLDTSAQEELDEKMRLEAIYRPEVTRLFNKIARDFRNVVAATGQAVDARNYRPEFEASLANHYRRTQAFFTDRITDGIEGKIIQLKQNEEERRSLKDLIAAALVAWRTDSASRQSLQISNTNQMQMQESLAQARQQITEEELPTDNRTLAAVAWGFLRRFFKARTERIIVSETQAAAESTRNIEATALAGGVPFPLQRVEGVEPAVPRRRVTKSWRDIQGLPCGCRWDNYSGRWYIYCRPNQKPVTIPGRYASRRGSRRDY
jgi:hypothetical protein